MKKSSLLFLLITIMFISFGFTISTGPAEPAPAVQSKDSAVKWITIQELNNMVQDKTWKKSKKKVMIDLYTDWCGWCKRMDAGTFSDPDVAAYLKDNFHSVKLDAETTETIVFGDQEFKFIPGGRKGTNEIAVTLGAVNGRIGYPTIVFLDEEMNKVLVSPGYKDAAGFKKYLVFINEEHYKTSTWEEFDKIYKAN